MLKKFQSIKKRPTEGARSKPMIDYKGTLREAASVLGGIFSAFIFYKDSTCTAQKGAPQ